MKKLKILFLLKDRSYSGYRSYGLLTSCELLKKALEKYNIECIIKQIVDTTFIDNIVYTEKPDYVVIEAIWAECKRLPQIFKLHPKVKKWSIRLHSKTPFISNESQAIKYIKEYQELSEDFPKFNVSVNNEETYKELYYSLGLETDYLPNIYTFNNISKIKHDKHIDILDIGCFGYLRIQKNILIQAMAAIGFANKYNKTLHFHINHSDIDKSESVHKNLISLFKDSKHKLIQHAWAKHSDFINIVKTMDISMAVSNTETFCITIMDSVVNNIPVVVSKEIDIIAPIYYADPNKIESIISKLEFVYLTKFLNLHSINKYRLNNHNDKAIKIWLNYLNYTRYK